MLGLVGGKGAFTRLRSLRANGVSTAGGFVIRTPQGAHVLEGMEPSQSSGVKGETESPVAFVG